MGRKPLVNRPSASEYRRSSEERRRREGGAKKSVILSAEAAAAAQRLQAERGVTFTRLIEILLLSALK